jgi:hypothetical protein
MSNPDPSNVIGGLYRPATRHSFRYISQARSSLNERVMGLKTLLKMSLSSAEPARVKKNPGEHVFLYKISGSHGGRV